MSLCCQSHLVYLSLQGIRVGNVSIAEPPAFRPWTAVLTDQVGGWVCGGQWWWIHAVLEI